MLGNKQFARDRICLALVVSALILKCAVSASAADLSGSYAWNPVCVGGGGWVTGFCVNPTNPNVKYCRTDSGNSYRWNNSTSTWAPMLVYNTNGSGIPASVAASPGGFQAEEVALDPSNINVVYMSFPANYSIDMSYPSVTNTVYKSTDGGVHFSPTGLVVAGSSGSSYRYVSARMKVDPNNSNVVYYGSSGNGLYVTTNGGTTWSSVASGGAPANTTNVFNLAFYGGGGTTTVNGQSVSKVIYLDEAPNGAGWPTSGDAYASTNGGQNWTDISSGVSGLTGNAGVMTVDQNGNLYIAAANSGSPQVFKYSGGSWTSFTNLPNGSGVQNVAVDPANVNRIFAMGPGGDLSITTNAGSTWTDLGNMTFANSLGWCPVPFTGWRSNSGVFLDSSGNLYCPQGNEGMLYMSAAETQVSSPKWTIISQGINEFCTQGVIIPKGSGDRVALDVEDDTGVVITNPATYTSTWVNNLQVAGSLSDADGLAWCPNAPTFVVYSNANFWSGSGDNTGYSSNFTANPPTWQLFSTQPDNTGRAGQIAISARGSWGLGSDHMVILPDNNGLPIYSTNGGSSWTTTSTFPTTDGGFPAMYYIGAHQLVADPFTANKYYCKVADGPLCVSTDGGVTWSTLSSALPSETWEGCLATNMNVQNDLWFCNGFQGSTTPRTVYHSTNGGSTWTASSFFSFVWEVGLGAGTGNGGDAPYTVYCYGLDAADTGWGMFRSTNAGSSWDRVSYYPNGILDECTGIAASWDTFGLVYMSWSGQTASYGQLISGAPAAPAGLTATPGNAQVALTWSASSGATSYNVLRSTTSGSGYAQVTNLGATSYTNTGLSNGTTYYYVVNAVNSSGTSGYSNQASTTPVAAPPAPTGLTAAAGNSQVALAWTASTGATSYNVLRSTTSGSGYAQVVNVSTTSYTNTGLTNGTTYYFVVAAVNSAGTSANSSQVSAVPSAGSQLWSEPFNYAAGALPTVSGGTWSGPTSGDLWSVAGSGVGTGSLEYSKNGDVFSGSGSAALATISTTGETLVDSYTFGTGFTSASTTTGYLYIGALISFPGVASFGWSGLDLQLWKANGQGSGYTDEQALFGLDDQAALTLAYATRGMNTGSQGMNWTVTSSTVSQSVSQANFLVIRLNFTGNTIRFFINPDPGQSTPVGYSDVDSGEIPVDPSNLPFQTLKISRENTTAGSAYFDEIRVANSFTNLVSSGSSTPAAPTGMVATPGNAQVALSWSASTGATSYNVLRSTVSGSGYAQVTNVGTTAYTNTGLTNGTTYYFVVAAVNAAGTSANSSQVSATPAAAPPAPTGLTAKPGNAQVALSWSASTGATSYNVLRSTVSGSGYAQVTNVTTTAYTNTGLTNGTTYYFVVAALNVAGTSANSSQASAAPVAPPAAPTGLTAAPHNAQVALSWSASTGATSYNVLRSTVSGSGYALVTNVSTATYTNTGLTNGTTYYFVVAAVNAGGTSANSSQVSAVPVAPPAAPTGLSATPGNAQVSLAWTASTGATSYNVYRGTTSGGESATAIATGVTVVNYTNTGLTNGVTYYYKVAALNAGGTSGYSNEASATPAVSQLMSEPFSWSAGALPTVSGGKWSGPTTGDMWSVSNTGVGTGSLEYSKSGHSLNSAGLASIATINSTGETIVDSYTIGTGITSASTTTGYVYVGCLISFPGVASFGWSGLDLQLWKTNGQGSYYTDEQAYFGLYDQASPLSLVYGTRGMNTGSQGVTYTTTSSTVSQSVSQANFLVIRLNFTGNTIRFFINPDPGQSTPIGYSDYDSGEIAVDPSNLPFQTLKISRENTTGGSAWVDEIRIANSYTNLVSNASPILP